MNFKQKMVHTRVRLQRGQAFASMVFTTVTVVGVWKGSFPDMELWMLLIIGAICYLGGAWLLGWIDEVAGLWKTESEKYGSMNPYTTNTLETVQRIEEKLDASLPLSILPTWSAGGQQKLLEMQSQDRILPQKRRSNNEGPGASKCLGCVWNTHKFNPECIICSRNNLDNPLNYDRYKKRYSSSTKSGSGLSTGEM